MSISTATKEAVEKQIEAGREEADVGHRRTSLLTVVNWYVRPAPPHFVSLVLIAG